MSCILIYVEHKENRRLLAECLGQRHEIVIAQSAHDLEVEFDCGIFDGVALSRIGHVLQDRRKSSDPNFLPCVLITSRQDLRLASASLWHMTDELIFTPIEKVELIARVEVLLRARDFSLRLNEAKQQEAVERRRAEEADRSKMQFLGMISHELRTPLASIKGFSSSLLAEDVRFDSDTQQEFIKVIDEEADKLNDLVGQLLDLSRLQAGALRISPRRHLVTDILEEAQAQLDVLTREHELHVEMPRDLPPVMADSARIAQVLTNLIGNATKYSPPASRIDLRISAQPEHVLFEVVDQGTGIPVEERETVFEAFQQIERKGTSVLSTGAGLGLAICRGLVEAHGGQIWIANTDGPGTTVDFTLPIAAS